MRSISITKARQDFFKIIRYVISKNEPVQISAKSENVVIVPESEWKGIMESLYLLSLPGMKEKLDSGTGYAYQRMHPAGGNTVGRYRMNY